MKAVETVSQERLLIEAAQQDPLCFADLYEAHFDRVYGYIARRVPMREDAEDITAEVFHQALVNLWRFQWRGIPFAAWLFRIAAHLIADRWPRAGREESFDEREWEDEAANGSAERRALLMELVATLPNDQREVVEQRFIAQRSIRDTARDMGRTEGAIKQLQFRALANLRAQARGGHD